MELAHDGGMNALRRYFHAQACNNAWSNLRPLRACAALDEFFLAQEAALRANELAALDLYEAEIWLDG